MDAVRETERVATTLATQGVVAVPDVVPSVTCDRLVAALDDDIAVVGSRNMLHWHGAQTLVAAIRSHPLLTGLLGEDRVAVQCTYFQKSAQTNWLVPLHQDLSIPVQERVAHASLKGWSRKEGCLFVQPPAAVLDSLLAVRIHLDACGPQDGPRRVIPGSHRQGPIPSEAAMKWRDKAVTCVAARGDALVMRPLLLHASSHARGIGRRRVLHVLFGPPDLPHGLRWAAVT